MTIFQKIFANFQKGEKSFRKTWGGGERAKSGHKPKERKFWALQREKRKTGKQEGVKQKIRTKENLREGRSHNWAT